MISIKINSKRYCFNKEQVEYILEKYNVDSLISAKRNIVTDCFSDPELKNKTSVEINYNLLRRVFEKFEIDLEMEISEELRIKEEEELIEKEEKKYQKQLDEKVQREKKLEEERTKVLEQELSKEELEHVQKIQEKLKIEQKMANLREDACARIKIASSHVSRMFETFNNIVMDGNIQDAKNLEQGILYRSKKGFKYIIVQDYYNVDHKVSLEDAQKMVDEIEDHFYSVRDKKQELYNQVAAAKTEEEIKQIRFK